jgi:uncharacterized damage-inducible protein DinB
MPRVPGLFYFMKRPDLAKVPSFYHSYIYLVSGSDLNLSFQENKQVIGDFLAAIPEEKWNYRYAEGKWSIKEMVQHMIDADRIFAYRALCIARGEKASLPGFDENTYAGASNAGHRTKEALLQEYRTVQQATALLFQSFDENQLERSGISNNNPIQVRAIGFISIGHMLHHKKVLQEKYGQ